MKELKRIAKLLKNSMLNMNAYMNNFDSENEPDYKKIMDLNPAISTFSKLLNQLDENIDNETIQKVFDQLYDVLSKEI
jgi:hypothetical protein